MNSINLTRQEYSMQAIIAPELFEDHREYLIDINHQRLISTLKLPAKVLQEREVIASYPATLWQHIKMKLGLKYEKVEVVLTEHVVFPEWKWPEKLGSQRIFIQPDKYKY